MSELYKTKNVPEELKNFLESHPEEWFTNEQLADRLCYTSSGIRNAVTKLKGTNLIKTKFTGSLAYRAWHTAPEEFDFPLADSQKRLAQRKCNGCGTQYSRYWRSDLEEKNGWLCNNCGMNQRRGRGIHRINSASSKCGSEEPTPGLNDIAPSAEPDFITKHNCFPETKVFESSQQTAVSEETAPSVRTTPVKRRPPYPTYVDPSKRKCGHCGTTKSAGKWRRDRECLERYLCNKCGMNQRRAQLRLEQQQQQQAIQESFTGPSNEFQSRQTRFGKLTKTQPCHLCSERIPSYVTDCGHRICGECTPALIKSLEKEIKCPVCTGDKLIPTSDLGNFIDSLSDY